MISPALEGVLRRFDPGGVTEVFLWLLLVLLALFLFGRRTGRLPTLTAQAPAVLATAGIFGTFVGIVVGLLDFDPAQLDESIEGLLQGLKTAFVSSIAGLGASLVFRAVEPVLVKKEVEPSRPEVGPEDVVAVLTEQRDLLQATRDAIAGSEESSLAGQIKLLRGDLRDRQRAFEAELWERLSGFAEMLSKSATETVIEALKEVIVDFNRHLTEQFGDNFKKLDESVQGGRRQRNFSRSTRSGWMPTRSRTLSASRSHRRPSGSLDRALQASGIASRALFLRRPLSRRRSALRRASPEATCRLRSQARAGPRPERRACRAAWLR